MERVRELSEDVRDIVSSILLFPGVFADKRSGTWWGFYCGLSVRDFVWACEGAGVKWYSSSFYLFIYLFLKANRINLTYS